MIVLAKIQAMTRKNILVTLLYWSLISAAFSQNLKGIVTDAKTRHPLESATVYIFPAGGQTPVQSLITAPDGYFNAHLPAAGDYDLKVHLIGYEPLHRQGWVIHAGDNEIALTMTPNGTTELQTVEVTTTRSTIETQMDKKVFNVGQELVAKAGNATDILNNVPSVNVSPLGAVSLRGNSSVRILINGKPSALTANGGLTQIPAETIEKVEVITNPSAEYDAQGAAGIINIILKRNKKSGFSSSFTLHGGLPTNNGGGINANFKTNKFNVFTDVRAAHIAFDGDGIMRRTNLQNSESGAYIHQDIQRFREFKRINTYVGTDVYINPLNTLTFSYFYRYNVNRDSVLFENQYKDAAQNTFNNLRTLELYREPQRSNMLELNYVKQFKQPKKQLKFASQYTSWNDDENENVTEGPNDSISAADLSLRSRDLESSKEFMAQGDYNMPVGQKGKFSAGLKTEIRRIDSDYGVWENNSPLDSMTNVLRYTERIYGVYTQYSNVFKKVQYQVGLRLENFNTGSEDLKNIFYTDKHYTNLFPSAHLTYKAGEQIDMQLSYSKRIDRPGFYQLNPFGGIADRRNIRIGNPDLNPMYIDVAEFGLLWKFENGLVVNPSTYYQHTRNLFEILVTRNADNILIEKPVNLGKEDRLGFELNTTFSPYKWWFLSSDFNAFRYEQQGLFTVSDMAWFTKLNSRIKYGKWAIQHSFNYTGARISGQVSNRAVFYADMSIGRDILKDKAILSLRGDNIFGTRVNRYSIASDAYTLYAENRPYRSRFMLSFNYKLNRTKSDKDRLPE